MTIARGDVVIVAFPFASGTAAKERPALVVQSNRWNQSLSNTVVVQNTGRAPPAGVDTSVHIDPATPDGAASGIVETVLGQLRQRRHRRTSRHPACHRSPASRADAASSGRPP
jgi:mRNA-degrading endonuclease toxin of MazEF toxin-antitoxin module